MGGAEELIGIEPVGGTWRLSVPDGAGGRVVVEVAAPMNQAEREDVALLLSSLLATGPRLATPPPAQQRVAIEGGKGSGAAPGPVASQESRGDEVVAAVLEPSASSAELAGGAGEALEVVDGEPDWRARKPGGLEGEGGFGPGPQGDPLLNEGDSVAGGGADERGADERGTEERGAGEREADGRGAEDSEPGPPNAPPSDTDGVVAEPPPLQWRATRPPKPGGAAPLAEPVTGRAGAPPPFRPRGLRPLVAAGVGTDLRAPFGAAPTVHLAVGLNFRNRFEITVAAVATAPGAVFLGQPTSLASGSDGLAGVRWALDRRGGLWLGGGGGVRSWSTPNDAVPALQGEYEAFAYLELRVRRRLRRWLVLEPYVRVAGEIPGNPPHGNDLRVPVTVQVGLSITAMRNGGMGLRTDFGVASNSGDRFATPGARPR